MPFRYMNACQVFADWTNGHKWVRQPAKIPGFPEDNDGMKSTDHIIEKTVELAEEYGLELFKRAIAKHLAVMVAHNWGFPAVDMRRIYVATRNNPVRTSDDRTNTDRRSWNI